MIQNKTFVYSSLNCSLFIALKHYETNAAILQMWSIDWLVSCCLTGRLSGYNVLNILNLINRDNFFHLVLNHVKKFGSGGIRTHAPEETGALNQRLRPLGHATLMEFIRVCNAEKMKYQFRIHKKCIFIFSRNIY